MRAELQKKLFEKYPKIFSKREKSTRDNLMYFGFDHDDGWYWLIDNLCNTIQNYIDSNYKWSTKRHGFLWLKKRIIRIDLPQLVAVQVKEKFGRLCFYVDFSDEFVEGIIRFAEDLSGTICEMCGTTKEVGKTSGWIKTICKGCIQSNERLKDREWIPNTVA